MQKGKKERVTDDVLDFYSGEEVMSLYKVRHAKRNRIPICRIAGKNYIAEAY